MSFLKKIIVAVLFMECRAIVKKYKPFIIAVTGSVGKTSTKDAIYHLLKDQSKFVRKSEKSMNSEIGLPLTIIGAPNAWHSLSGWLGNIWKGLALIIFKREYPDCLILEVGADHPGDIQRVAKWLKPDIAVITRISKKPVHVEFFLSPEQVFQEKAALAKAVNDSGSLVLFADDENVLSLASEAKSRGVKVVSFGLSSGAEIRGSDQAISYDEVTGTPTGLAFHLHIRDLDQIVVIPGVVGKSLIYSLLAAAAVGKACHMPEGEILSLLSTFAAPHGRTNIIPGLNGSTIIDDTYNSSPDATEAALSSLKDIQTTGTKIAILGDMMELGRYAVEEHRRIGKLAATIASRLITVGSRSRLSAEEALQNGFPATMVEQYNTASQAAEVIPSSIKPGDVILVKGSQSMRMERVVKALLKEPEKADRLLVRQEREWMEKN